MSLKLKIIVQYILEETVIIQPGPNRFILLAETGPNSNTCSLNRDRTETF